MFEKKWEAQCDAAVGINARFGTLAALDYLLGEKLDEHVRLAATNVKFRNELPRFMARVREVFRPEEVEAYFAALEAAANDGTRDAETAKLEQSGLLLDQPGQRARLKRLQPLRELLLAERMGAS